MGLFLAQGRVRGGEGKGRHCVGGGLETRVRGRRRMLSFCEFLAEGEWDREKEGNDGPALRFL